MKFKYKKINSQTIRPIIPITLLYNGNSVRTEVLVDSGADICIFDSQLAEILDINLVKGTKLQVTGITGFPQDYYIHPISIDVGGWKYKIEAGFTKMGNNSYGVVGQKGFFQLFKIKFDFSKTEIELTSHSRH